MQENNRNLYWKIKLLKQSTDVRYVIEKLSKLTFFLVSQFLCFRHTKQNSKNVADTSFKQRCFLAAPVYSIIAHSLYYSCFKNYSLLKSVMEILIIPELGIFLYMWVSGNLWCKNNFQEVSFRNILFQKTSNII